MHESVLPRVELQEPAEAEMTKRKKKAKAACPGTICRYTRLLPMQNFEADG